MNRIGIRHEDKYHFERRVPLIPGDIKQLIEEEKILFTIESSEKRVFSDDEYRTAGADISDHLADCDVIFGVKEMPENYFERGKTYVFFSHVIKGQSYNMPMLKSLIQEKSTLIDYEKIENDKGQRLIFFGRFAGLAGMINTLWATGQRLLAQGINTPLSNLKQTYEYNSLKDAKADIERVGNQLKNKPLPASMTPLVIAVSGDGNVSQGALEILDLLPGHFISAEELKNKNFDKGQPVVKVNLLVSDYMIPNGARGFDLQHYIQHPDLYTSTMNDYLSEIHLFVNGIYWDEKYPRLIEKHWLRKMHSAGKLKLHTIGDISCDIHGSIECTETATAIEDPVFVYDQSNDTYEMGFKGDGIAVMAVDILPSELPREASSHFSEALKPYIKDIAMADFSKNLEDLHLPDSLKKAIIVHKGELTPRYKYLENSL